VAEERSSSEGGAGNSTELNPRSAGSAALLSRDTGAERLLLQHALHAVDVARQKRQFLYFCTSKASKLSTCQRSSSVLSAAAAAPQVSVFVLLYQESK
jgi:hypothetical protein